MSRTILIAGSGRSGTTWIQDALAQSNRLRTIFEPLYPGCGDVPQSFANRYLRPDADQPALQRYFERVLAGDCGNLWTLYRIRPEILWPRTSGVKTALFAWRRLAANVRRFSLLHPDGLAVKTIRANLLLAWLARHFDVPILYVTRHPGGFAASRLALGGERWDYRPVLDGYRADRQLQQDFLAPYDTLLEQPFSAAAGLAAVWAIENVLPLRWASEGRFFVSSYERLSAEPDREWPRICAALELKGVPGQALLAEPSQQVSVEMRSRTFDTRHFERWRARLSEDQRAEMQTVLDNFGVDLYRMDEPMPRGHGAYVTAADRDGTMSSSGLPGGD